MADLIFLSAITVGHRHRKDLGDIVALANNINEIGLIHPIVLTPDFRLICGGRRLSAARMLGWQSIPASILDLDPLTALQAEHDENEMRKDFTASERVDIADAIKKRMGERRGRPSAENVDNHPQIEQGIKSRELAAKRAGFDSDFSYRQAKKVVEHGVPELVEAMDSGEASISAAATIADLPDDTQKEIAASGSFSQMAKAVRTAAKEAALKTHPLPAPQEAKALAKETGDIVLDSNGKWQTNATPEEIERGVARRAISNHLKELSNQTMSAEEFVTALPDYVYRQNQVNARAVSAWLSKVIQTFDERG